MAFAAADPYSVDVQTKRNPENRERLKRKEVQPSLEVPVIPAPTVVWHPSVSLEKLISDFAAYRDSIIVS
jgi:hypothetical protein